MALVRIKLLGNVIHERLRTAGEVIEIDERHAETLIKDGVAELEKSGNRLLRKRGKKADDPPADPPKEDGDGDGDSSDDSDADGD